MRLIHNLFFIENRVGYRFFRFLARGAEKNRLLFILISSFERSIKKILFDCRRCDDCALFELFYLCPESKCPKGMRNGPCGGSRPDGKCEVIPGRLCIWKRVYKRAVNRKQAEMLKKIIPPRDWKLYETSSWINYFLKYDHSGKTLKIAHKSDK